MSCTPIAVSYGIHFNTVLFPLTFRELVGILEKKGYEISPNLPFPLPVGRMNVTGQIARKGRSSIGIDASGQSLRVNDVSIESALECFDEIAKTC